MATSHALRLTDGTTYNTFTSGDNMKLVDYEPVVSLNPNENITERFRVNFTSTTPATNLANIKSINQMFDQARNYARTETGDRIYAEFDEGATSTYWRSRIFNGRIMFDEKVLNTYQYDQTIQAEIEWEREPFWEGALTQLPLTNSSATDDTSGITVTNRYDGGTCQVETATVVGTITGDGNASFTLTAAGMTGSPITESVAVLTDDTPAEVATKAVTQLNTNSNITDLFNIAADDDDVVVTRLVPAANDATLNLAYDNDTCTGLTGDATSADTTAGSATAHENYVTIDGINDMTGDLPAPIKLQMYNSLNGSDAADDIYIYHNVHSTPTSLDHTYEGEDATGATVTAVADGTSSDGFYGSLAYAAQTETKIATWAISTTELTYMAGGYFAIIARWAATFPYSDMYLRLKLEGANSTLWEGDLRLVAETRYLWWLDSMQLPPYLAGQSNIKGINLVLYALRAQAGTHTIKLDFLQVSAISGSNGWLHFRSVDHGIEYQEYFTHDETEGFTYRTDTSSKLITEFTQYGGPLMLIPGYNQRLYFLTCDYNGVAEVDQSWTVKLWYRPRRSSL
jgi:hypothetical protein